MPYYMLLGFISCCPALKITLCGFKICCPDLYLSVRATIETVYILLSRLALLRGLHPSRLYWVSVLPNSYNARTPGDWESLSLSFGLQALRLFQAYSGPLGGIGPYLSSLWVTRWQPLEEPTSQWRGLSRRRSCAIVCLSHLRENKYLELLFYLFILSIFGRTIGRLA